MSGREMKKKKDDIIDILRKLSAIAEENAASTQQILASSEEQAASMGEIAEASRGLSRLAGDLQQAIARFKC